MSSFTGFAMKPDWCGCSLKNGITDNDQGNNYVSGLDNKIMNSPSKFKPRLFFYGNARILSRTFVNELCLTAVS